MSLAIVRSSYQLVSIKVLCSKIWYVRATHLLAMKFGFGRVRPKVALYSSRMLSSSLYASVEAVLVDFQERKSNSAHDMYPPGSGDTCQLINPPHIQKANTD